MFRGFFILCWVWLAAASPVAGKSYSITNFDVTARVMGGGDLEVTETITYHFEEGTFSYAFREIPIRGFRAAEFLEISSPDTEILRTSVNLKEGWSRSLEIRWDYPETTGIRTFVLRYRMEGILQAENGLNVLDWNAVGGQWEVGLQDVDVEIILPRAFSPLQLQIEPEGRIRQTAEESIIDFHRDQLKRRNRYRVIVRFPQMFDAAPPPENAFVPILLLTLLGGTLILVPAAVLFWSRSGKVRSDSPSLVYSAYPDPAVSPGEAAYLIHRQSNPRIHIPATLYHWAEQGVLRLQGEKKTGFLGISDVKVQAVEIQPPEEIAGWEGRLLEGIREEPDLKKFKKKSTLLSAVRKELEKHLEDRGFISKNRKELRLGWIVRSVVALLISAGFFTLVMVNVWKDLLGLAILLLSGSTVWLVMSLLMEVVSLEGARVRDSFRSYARWLREEIERLLKVDSARAADLFSNNLAVLSMDSKVNQNWIKKLKKKVARDQAQVPLPPWVKLQDETGLRIDTATATGEQFGLFTETVGAMAAAVGAGAGSSGSGAGGGGAGGGGGGAG